jgi:hypothetical protein
MSGTAARQAPEVPFGNPASLREWREKREKAPKALSLGQLMAKRILLGPWLMEGETAMIWAATGVGKSWLALSIALAVALDMITEDEVKRCREAAKGLRKDASVTFDERTSSLLFR